ncbi:MAG: insulinase family protein [Candidatus Hydrogenedentes bacterium]|nr:insulinase family protein [Candidatus Hydrogenedentota bacterium]
MSDIVYTQEDAEVITLDNGLAVCLEPLPYLHSASIGVWIRTGSGNERADENGIAHFLEHLFFKGTSNRNVHEIMAAIESRGGQLNAFTSREYTCLYVKVLEKHVATGIEILADLVKNSLFCDLEKERNVILEEIASIEDTPDEYVHDLITEHHWPGHALGRSISGSAESVSALGYDHVVDFFRRWYRPENMVFSIAGNFDRRAVIDQVSAEFGSISVGAVPPLDAAPRFQSGIRAVHRDIAQSHITLAFPAPSLYDERKYAYDMTSNILGGGSTSRLFERIREEEGLAYSIYTFDAFYLTAGSLGVYAAVAPQQLANTLELTFAELRKLRDNGLSEEELELNREQIKGGMLMAMESTFTRMARMAKSMMYYGKLVPISEIISRVDAVTLADVKTCCAEIFTPDQSALLVLGPEEQTMPDVIAL